MLGRPRLSPAEASDATKVRQANRRLHRRLELAHQAKQNLLDDQLAGLDRRVMRKRELPSVLSPNYDDAVQQMAHSEISLALKCLREVAMRTALERLRDLRMAKSLEDQAQRVDDLESQLKVAEEQNRLAALQMVHVDKAMKEKERVTKQRIELLEHLNRAHQRFIYKNVLPGAGLAAQKRSQGQRYLKAARTCERRRSLTAWPRSGEEMLDIAEVNAWA